MQVRRNEKTITKAFNGLRHNKHNHLVAGLRSLLQDAVMFIYEQHRIDGHMNHLSYGDTYGWALYYNGQMIDKKINNGPYVSDFSVSDELASRIAESKGYVGLVMAGMNPGILFWEKHEIPYMEMTMDMIVAEYLRFFQK
jgi:hypothetical protein